MLLTDFLSKIAAYLMGCPIRGVILDPIVAMQMGIQGQVISVLLCSLMDFTWFRSLLTQQFNHDGFQAITNVAIMRYTCNIYLPT